MPARSWTAWKLIVFPQIGKLQLDKIEPPKLLEMLRKVEARGALEMAKCAHRVMATTCSD